MTKRVFTLALALLMLLALVPVGAVEAAAASAYTTSDELIAIIKDWEGYSEKPYEDVSHYSIGYGTMVPSDKLEYYKEHGMSKEEAEEALRDSLADTETRVNSFIDKHGIQANQGIFDALVSISYNCGSGWLYKESTLRTAVIQGWTGNDLLFAFGQWSTAGGNTRTSLINRRMAECNMYLNGKYARKAPANYSYVLFDANGGEREIKTQCFDTNTTEAIRATATYKGYQFMGWYTDATGGEKVTKLDSSVKGYTLYARWKAASGTKLPTSEITGTKVNYTCTVKNAELSAFHSPDSKSSQVASYQENAKLTIVAEYMDTNGICWGKTSAGGWVNLAFTSANTTTSQKVNVAVTVTGTGVNIRKGPGTSYGRVKQVNKGYKLTITEIKNAGGYTWGKSSEGWIALKYTNYSTASSGSTGSGSTGSGTTGSGSTGSGSTNTGTTQDKVIATGKVAVKTKLNVRKGAGTGYAIAARLSNGTAVKIYQTKKVGSVTWGRIDQGWISLEYVKLDKENTSTGSGSTNTGSGSTNTGSGSTNTGSGSTNTNTNTNTNTGSTVAGAAGIGTVKVTSYLNVRKEASTDSKVVGNLKNGAKVQITEKKTVGKTVWGRIANGWISLKYVVMDKVSTTTKATGTVSAGTASLRVRENPNSTVIKAYLKTGDRITILERKFVGNMLWGRISRGWIQMPYVIVDGTATVGTSSGGSTSGGGSTSTGGTTSGTTSSGTITGDYLRIRSGAGTKFSVVGYLHTGDKVTILETKTVGGVKWGRISKGWISMDYVKLAK